MAKIMVTKIVREGKTNGGTPKWNCMGTIDGEQDVFDVWDKPEIGVEFEGKVTESQYGKSVSTGGGRGGRGGGGYRKDPEEQKSIARQNALAHSTEIIVTVAKLTVEAAFEFTNKETGEVISLSEAKKAALAEAKKLLHPTNIINVAERLYAYSKPVETASSEQVVTPQASPASAPVPMTKEAVNAAFPEANDQKDDPTPAKGRDVPVGDIPF